MMHLRKKGLGNVTLLLCLLFVFTFSSFAQAAPASPAPESTTVTNQTGAGVSASASASTGTSSGNSGANSITADTLELPGLDIPADRKQTVLDLWDGFKAQGLSDEMTAGILGNIYGECSFKIDMLDKKPQGPAANNHQGEVLDVSTQGGAWVGGGLQWEYTPGKDPRLKLYMDTFSQQYPAWSAASLVNYYMIEAKSTNANTEGGWIDIFCYIDGGGKAKCSPRSEYAEYKPEAKDFHSFDEMANCTSIVCATANVCANACRAGTPRMPERLQAANAVYEALTGRSAGASSGGVEISTENLMGVPDELDLVGMRQPPNYTEYWQDLPESSRETLSATELYQIDELVSDINMYNSTGPIRWLRVGIMALGILVFFYVLALFMAWCFDQVNIFFDFSIFRICTFGKLQPMPKGLTLSYGHSHIRGGVAHDPMSMSVGKPNREWGYKDPRTGVRYIGIMHFIMIELILIIFASLLVNGSLFSFIRWIVLWIGSHGVETVGVN